MEQETLYPDLATAEREAYLLSQRPKPVQKDSPLDAAIALSATARTYRTPFEPAQGEDSEEDEINDIQAATEERIKQKRHLLNLLQQETDLQKQYNTIAQDISQMERAQPRPKQQVTKGCYEGDADLEQKQHRKLQEEISRRKVQKEIDNVAENISKMSQEDYVKKIGQIMRRYNYGN